MRRNGWRWKMRPWMKWAGAESGWGLSNGVSMARGRCPFAIKDGFWRFVTAKKKALEALRSQMPLALGDYADPAKFVLEVISEVFLVDNKVEMSDMGCAEERGCREKNGREGVGGGRRRQNPAHTGVTRSPTRQPTASSPRAEPFQEAEGPQKRPRVGPNAETHARRTQKLNEI
ncbi:FRIGIDA-like protein 4a [Pyrus ussuriensis x Pyrus communis]|uniref:FRIGIDA-like protein n=1 Tax=Pyrus ussuriensis x Pyrus communis TaxID=2448454 RepID=A0A5N5EUU2_9ROSA|nr:FRIGIDA-like protein 4a [Pyrus ussuriensis x Pyrus communis]